VAQWRLSATARSRPLNRLATRVRDRLLIADPGLVRLDAAVRTTVAVMLTTVLLLWIVGSHSGAQVLVLVGGLSSWISAIPVNDVNLSDRRLTTALIPIPAIAGLALSTAMAGEALREDIVFLIVLFVSVYVRRYGQRFVALGAVGTFAYFFGLFIGTQPAQLVPLAAVVVLGTASTYVMRFVFFPKHARGSLYWVTEAVLAQLRLVLDGLAALRQSLAAERLRLVMANIARVNETMLTVQEHGVVAGAFDGLTFRCEVAAENLIVATGGANPESRRRAEAERELSAVIAEVRHVAASEASDPDTSSPQRDAILKEAARGGGAFGYGIGPSTRQAIQVTVAAAIAMVIGEHISAERWYWAVITAFIVFTGTTSAGETLTRAWAGFLGTALGVVAGTGIGLLLQHNVVLESWLLFSSMLFAAYFFRVGLGAAWFFVTLILVTLYELLGRFTEAVLVVRIFEVLTGVVCGGLAATVILPISTRAVFRADVRAALEALRDGLESIAGATSVDAQSASRRFDAAVRRLRSRVTPLHSGPTFAGSSLFARRWLRNLELCAYYARNAVCASRAPGASVQGAIETIDGLLSSLDADPRWPGSVSAVPEEEQPEILEGGAAVYVGRIRDILQRSASTFG
jgi:hypothetical protein